MTTSPAIPRVDAPRNVAAILLDIAIFVTGLAFIPSSTVLVGLATHLTDDKALIGIVGMTWSVTWFLPQLFAAKLVRHKERQKPYVVIPSLIGRPLFLVIAGWLVYTRAEMPTLTIWVMIACIGLFNLCDALAGVAWFDILSRSLSTRSRTRVLTFGQITSGILGLGASEIVKRVLGAPGIPFPVNYGILFACTGGLMILALGAFILLKEVPMRAEEQQAQRDDAGIMQALRAALKHDLIFRRVLLVRFLTGIEAMAASFYLVVARERFGFADSSEGDFTQALILGGLVGVSALGYTAERFSTRRVIHFGAVLFVIAPLLATLASFLPISAGAAYVIFAAIFLLRGALEHTLMLGPLGYLLDVAPERHRAMYVGAINTLSGVVSMTPFLGGLWLNSFRNTSATAVYNPLPYVLMFGLVTLSSASGLLVSLALPKPSKPAA